MGKTLFAVIVFMALAGCTYAMTPVDSGAGTQAPESVIAESNGYFGNSPLENERPYESSEKGSVSSVSAEAISSASSTTTEPKSDLEHPNVQDKEPQGSAEVGVESPEDKDSLITFKITNSAGQPISKVYLKIDWYPSEGRGIRSNYSNQDGVIHFDFSKYGVGKHPIYIVEEYKIKKEIRYEVDIEKLPAEVNLIWDFGNPDEIAYAPEATATLYFKDEDGKPITDGLVSASYNTVDDGINVGYDILAEIGTLNNNGSVVWVDPPLNTKVELQVLGSDNYLRLYDATILGGKGNTDYHFVWGNAVMKE